MISIFNNVAKIKSKPIEILTDVSLLIVEPIGSQDVIDYLDIIILILIFCCIIHASHQKYIGIAFFNIFCYGVLGYLIEQSSIQFGGTHCHASSKFFNISPCSSLNSVLFYVPWLYISMNAIETNLNNYVNNIGNKNKNCNCVIHILKSALLAPIAFFLFCGPYEFSGPLNGWWIWPRITDNVLVDEFTSNVAFPMFTNDISCSVKYVSEHAANALKDRYYGVPVMAAYFHCALGFGIFTVTLFSRRILHNYLINNDNNNSSLVGKDTEYQRGVVCMLATVLGCIFGPVLALIWDIPTTLLENGNIDHESSSSSGSSSSSSSSYDNSNSDVFISRLASVPLIMVSIFVLNIIFATTSKTVNTPPTTSTGTTTTDNNIDKNVYTGTASSGHNENVYLLIGVVSLHSFMIWNIWCGATSTSSAQTRVITVPAEFKLCITVLSVLGILFYYRRLCFNTTYS